MRALWMKALLLGLTAWAGLAESRSARAEQPLADKTLVVWAAPATLDQRGGSALTLDNGSEAFDGIVFGEIEPKRWMPGSNGWSRTEKKQAAWAAENAAADQFVQIAVVYRGKDVAVYRNGQPYANYTMGSAPQVFGPSSVVLFGRRHLTAGDPANSFAGRIKDARIYNKPLDAATLGALRPGQVSAELPPWAWWSFADEGLREKTGRFPANHSAGRRAARPGLPRLGR